jgi:biopolymer transport protein ExbD
MRIPSSKVSLIELDMTPMIDMTFQLIAFFMFTINFNNDIVNKDVRLPVAEIARPVERAMLRPLFLNVDREGRLLTGTDVGIIDLRESVEQTKLLAYLQAEKQSILDELFVKFGKLDESEELKATVIIRAHEEVDYGPVQDLIRCCRVAGFSRFSLRANLKQRDATK